MSSYRRRLLLANQSEENIILYGNSVQDGTPTPDAPIDIMSLENPTITVEGEECITIEGYTLRGIGNYKDRIYTKDGKVWFEQRSWQFTVDKSLTLNQNYIGTLGIQFYTNAGIVPSEYRSITIELSQEEKNPGLCTHFRYHDSAYRKYALTNCCLFLGTRAWFISDNFASMSKIITWQAENHITIVYPLENPIITEITGFLAEKILAIDKTKNITIASANGVSGEVEVIEE